MSDAIILDDLCLRKGLPPLSMGRTVALKMIHSLSASQKREVLRKIRKIAKSEINRKCRLVSNKNKRDCLRKSLERQSNLSKFDKQPHSRCYTSQRLILVKQHLESKIIDTGS